MNRYLCCSRVLCLIAVLVLSFGAPPRAEVADYLPAEPHVAGVYTLDLAELAEKWAQRFGMFAQRGAEEFEQEMARMDEQVGMSFRDDVLRAFGPEFGFSLEFPPYEEYLAAESGAAASTVLFESGVLVAGYDDLDRTLRALGALAKLGSMTLTREEERLVLSPAEQQGTGPTLHGRIVPGYILFSGSAERIAAAADGYGEDARLNSGSDFRFVASQIEGAPETLTYVNLPEIRNWIETGVGGRDVLDSDEYAAYAVWLSDEWMGHGAIFASSRAGGGVRSTTFAPEPVAGLFSPLNGSMSMMFMPLLSGARGLLPTPADGEPDSSDVYSHLIGVSSSLQAIAAEEGNLPVSGGWAPAEGVLAGFPQVDTADLDDPWGNPYLISSDGEKFCIASTGKDGSLDRSWAAGIEAQESDDDFVICDGNLVHWPR
ncbi:hypothetical protein ABI59_18325 [Acidobacteria bacterium Mor1]|nr:hypothetical protein ABI59_18325 [Acidobacteria bacterium Mor1]